MLARLEGLSENKTLNKISTFVLALLVMSMPLMKHIYIGEAKINFAFSDLFLPIMGILLLVNIKSFFEDKRYLLIVYFMLLVASLIVSQYMSQWHDGFQQASNMTTLVEIVKTMIVGFYFLSAVILIKDKEDLKKMTYALSFSSVLVLIIGFSAFFYAHNEMPFFIEEYQLRFYSIRFYGTLKDPNLCALFLTCVLFISLMNIKMTKSKCLKMTFYFLSVTTLVAIVFTGSRGGYISLAGGLLVFILLNIKEMMRLKKRGFMILGSLVLVLAGLYFLDMTFNEGDFFKYAYVRLNSMLENGIFSDIRFTLSTVAFKMGNDHFLFGVGKGAYQINSHLYVAETLKTKIDGVIPHNTILSFYAQQGIIGTLIFLSMPVVMLYKMMKSKRFTNKYLLPLLASVFISSLALNLENIRFLWFIFGLIFAIEKINLKQEVL